MKNQITTLFVLSVLSGHAVGATATTSEIEQGGRATVRFDTSMGTNEICVFPKRSALGGYKKDDLSDEIKLCRMNFHKDGSGAATSMRLDGSLVDSEGKDASQLLANKLYVTCPKLNSTNPGVLVVDIPKDLDPKGQPWTYENAAEAFCKTKSSIAKGVADAYEVDAKFKQSITCSYAPSALAAYHVSRMLGHINQTPVAVARTMDSNTHKGIADKALAILSGGGASVIQTTWNQFKNAHGTRSESKIFTDGGANLYGALSSNIKKETIYTEVSGVGPYDTRYTRFLQQPPFQRVANPASISEIAGDKAFANMIPVIEQMRDVSEMVLLDTLLSQDDRIGNIHFFLYNYKLLPDGKIDRKKLDKVQTAKLLSLLPSKSASRASARDFIRASEAMKTELTGGTVVRIMVLKDNDCGVDVDKRSNMMRSIDAIEQVRHMSPKTYKKLIALAQTPNAQLKDFFTQTLLYRAKDFEGGAKSFTKNLERAAQVLKQNCANGLLKLDLTDDFDTSGNWIPSQKKVNCDGSEA